MTTSCARSGPQAEISSRVANLLARYPGLTAGELAELIQLFPNMTLREKRIVSGDRRLARKLADFDRDHGDTYRAPLAELIVVLMLPLALAVFTLWWALG